jgi:hypothetical protein
MQRCSSEWVREAVGLADVSVAEEEGEGNRALSPLMGRRQQFQAGQNNAGGCEEETPPTQTLVRQCPANEEGGRIVLPCRRRAGAPPRGSQFLASLGGREERWKIHKAGLTVSAYLMGSRFLGPTNQRTAYKRWPGHLTVINAEKGFHPLKKGGFIDDFGVMQA